MKPQNIVESKGLNIGVFVHNDIYSNDEGLCTETLTSRSIYTEIIKKYWQGSDEHILLTKTVKRVDRIDHQKENTACIENLKSFKLKPKYFLLHIRYIKRYQCAGHGLIFRIQSVLIISHNPYWFLRTPHIWSPISPWLIPNRSTIFPGSNFINTQIFF